MAPVVATLFFVGSALTLAFGIYAANEVAAATREPAPPNVAWWEAGQGQLLVVQADPGSTWADLQVRADPPAHVSLRPPGREAPLAGPQGAVLDDAGEVSGGDALWVCVEGPARPVTVQVVHQPTGAALLRRDIQAPSCA